MNGDREEYKLERVISGGQTGADVAALIAASSKDIRTGGNAPANFWTDNGPDYSLRSFGLIAGGGCVDRSIKNVDDSDGTLCLIVHRGRGGTSKTIGYCRFKKWKDDWKSSDNGYRPVMVIDIYNQRDDKAIVDIVVNWLVRNKIRVLNVAGHRQSTSFVKPHFNSEPFHYQKRCEKVLSLIFEEIKHLGEGI